MKQTFSERVIKAAQSVPMGSITTYGDIARVCGSGGQAARSIAGILGRARKNGVRNIPFHRIVYSNGQVWKNNSYNNERAKLYKQEGIEIDKRGYVYDFELKRHQF